MSIARNWFKTDQEFRQVCGDAQSMARAEHAQEFASEMMKAANEHGINARLSERQLVWLCKLADRVVPPRSGG